MPKTPIKQDSGDELFRCPFCGKQRHLQEMDKSGICKQCATAKSADDEKLARSQRSFFSTDAGIITVIVVSVALIGAIAAGWFLWASHVETQIRNRISEMKEAADQRFAAGDFQSASQGYDAVLAFAENHKFKDDGFDILADAKRQQQATNAKLEQAEEVRRREQQRQAEAEAMEQKRQEAAALALRAEQQRRQDETNAQIQKMQKALLDYANASINLVAKENLERSTREYHSALAEYMKTTGYVDLKTLDEATKQALDAMYKAQAARREVVACLETLQAFDDQAQLISVAYTLVNDPSLDADRRSAITELLQ